MAVSRSEVQVQWSSSDSVSVTAAGNQTSDAATLQSSLLGGSVQLKADNAGTPSDGDTIDFYLLPTLGDPDGSGSDEYPAGDDHGIYLGTIDTYAQDGDNLVVALPVLCKSAKIYAKSNASSNAITVSACILQWYQS